MFGWRRKPDGFDWHTYVRTTIKLRRQERLHRLANVREAAADRVKAAGKAAVGGAKGAARSAGAGLIHGLRQTGAGAGRFVSAVGNRLDPVGAGVANAAAPALAGLSRSAIAGPVAVASLIALAAGLHRWWRSGLDADAIAPLAIGLGLALLALPAGLDRFGYTIPTAPRAGRGVALVACAAIAGLAGAGLVAWRGAPVLPSSLGALANIRLTSPLSPPEKPIEGRATVVSGDVVRIDGRLVRLAGIEAPDRQQTCLRQPGAKRWRCGEAAQSALERAVRGKSLACTVSGSDEAGRATGACTSEGRDIAADLVREGHAFSSASYLGGYASLEGEARRNKAGVWSGEAERPADFRNKAWEAARKTAPDGCPIKAKVTSAGKVYVLPWAPDYGSAAIRSAKGERWFCSEREAVAAGWRARDG